MVGGVNDGIVCTVVETLYEKDVDRVKLASCNARVVFRIHQDRRVRLPVHRGILCSCVVIEKGHVWRNSTPVNTDTFWLN